MKKKKEISKGRRKSYDMKQCHKNQPLKTTKRFLKTNLLLNQTTNLHTLIITPTKNKKEIPNIKFFSFRKKERNKI